MRVLRNTGLSASLLQALTRNEVRVLDQVHRSRGGRPAPVRGGRCGDASLSDAVGQVIHIDGLPVPVDPRRDEAEALLGVRHSLTVPALKNPSSRCVPPSATANVPEALSGRRRSVSAITFP